MSLPFQTQAGLQQYKITHCSARWRGQGQVPKSTQAQSLGGVCKLCSESMVADMEFGKVQPPGPAASAWNPAHTCPQPAETDGAKDHTPN